jgi:hypothetical protein
MKCPRCSFQLQNIVEYFTEENKFVYSKEYYCTVCKSSTIERFDEQGLFSSEWIDFNV